MTEQTSPTPPQARAMASIFLLCAVAGSIDTTAYLFSSHVFVANMTGNTVLLAISLLQGQHWEALLRGGLVLAFLAGILAARILARAGGTPKRKQQLAVLGVESLVLLLLAWQGSGWHAALLLPLLAVVLGTQNGAFRYIGGIHLNTAFITGDLEQLGEAIVDRKGPGQPNHSRPATEQSNSRPKVSAFLLSWIGYATGALLGGLGTHAFAQHAFSIPLMLAAAATAVVAILPESL